MQQHLEQWQQHQQQQHNKYNVLFWKIELVPPCQCKVYLAVEGNAAILLRFLLSNAIEWTLFCWLQVKKKNVQNAHWQCLFVFLCCPILLFSCFCLV